MNEFSFSPEGTELPFEIDENDGYNANSPYEYLYCAYSCAADGELGEAVCWAANGDMKFPDNPDLLAFFTIYNIKSHNGLKEKNEFDMGYKDKHGERLISMDRDDFTIRAYVALLLYYMAVDLKGNAKKCFDLACEMRDKFKHDISGCVAEMLLRKELEDGLEEYEMEQIRNAYAGLLCCQTIGDNSFSNYITSIIPLFEAICDELH